MVGYHYTSRACWRAIRKAGALEPYPMREELKQDGCERGIWIWPRRLRGAAHAGSVLWQLQAKADPHVVLLAVRYSRDDVWRSPHSWTFGGVIHTGALGIWKYHQSEKSQILAKPVPLDRIELVEEFDVVKALAHGKGRVA